MTIVEVLTWTEGTFELDVDTSVISDEYRYIPEKLKLELNLNTQNVLMDALRIYDEKKRDGTLMEETFPGGRDLFPSASFSRRRLSTTGSFRLMTSVSMSWMILKRLSPASLPR